MHSITMHFSIVFLTLFALAAASPLVQNLHAADQELLQRQQDVITLLENIAGQLPSEHLREIGQNYEFEPHIQNYENPSVVRYYVALVNTGHVQPQGTPYSYSVSQLRKEVALLTQILLCARDYETFLNTAAWARVNVNQEQFVTALSNAVLQREDMAGVILPPVYEVYPQYFFDSRIIQRVQDYVQQYGFLNQGGQGEHVDVYNVHVNYTSGLPGGENQIAYLTDDIGLAAYYSYVQLASYMLPQEQDSFQQGSEGMNAHIGHGARYYYIHQQLLARYNLERLGQGLDPIQNLDYYCEHIETPYQPNLRSLNGMNLAGRGEHIYVTPKHHNYDLLRLVRALEQRIIDAIDAGHVITPQGTFLSLYQPQGLNILGELIEGSGHSINPRYYGSYVAIARQLLGNAPEFNNIWEYTPSALELGQTAVRDPIFYQLYGRIMELFQYYQKALPAYQYNDVVVPGVNIQKIEVSDLVTFFSNYEVTLDNAVVQPVEQHLENQPGIRVKAQLKRLDHQQYQYSIHVQSQKVLPRAVVRVYIGPKYNYDGQPIDINVHRHYFYELDQFVYDLSEGQNVIVRNSHQSGFSQDCPSIQQLKERIQGAVRSQNPYYINNPEQLYGFPARLSLPKGSQSGLPLQLMVVITSGVQGAQVQSYGPVVEEELMTYQPQHYQIVGDEEYQQYTKNPVDRVTGGYQTVEVIPEYDSQIVTEGNWHWGYLYKRYPGSYYYPHWQQQYYNRGGIQQQGGPMGSQQGGILGGQGGVLGGQGGILGGQGGVFGGQGGVLGGQGGVFGGQSGVLGGQGGILGGQGGILGGQGGVLGGQGGVYGQQGQGVSGQQGGIIGGAYGRGIYGQQGQGVHSGIGGRIHRQGQSHAGYYGSGYYGGSQGGISQRVQDQNVRNYYQNQHISAVIGGGISLDGRPLGYPLDRPLADSAFYARNIYVQDIVVYHQDDVIPQY